MPSSASTAATPRRGHATLRAARRLGLRLDTSTVLRRNDVAPHHQHEVRPAERDRAEAAIDGLHAKLQERSVPYTTLVWRCPVCTRSLTTTFPAELMPSSDGVDHMDVTCNYDDCEAALEMTLALRARQPARDVADRVTLSERQAPVR